MPERTVKILGFRYTDEDGNWLLASRGQTVDFSEEDAARGDADGVFVTEEDAAAGEAALGPNSSDDELLEFVKDAKVGDVVDLAGDNQEFAQRLLDIETDATGGEPRKGVAQGLAAIVGSA